MNDQEIQLPEILTPLWVAERHAKLIKNSEGKILRLNCLELKKIDSLTISWFIRIQDSLEKNHGKLILMNLAPELQEELSKARRTKNNSSDEDGVKISTSLTDLPAAIGEAAYKLFHEVRDTLVLLSESLYWSTFGLFKSKTLVRDDVLNQMIRLGSTGLPITLLLSGLIGFTLALQSGIQLQKFGATIFLASGIGISMVTEIGPVLTAVILAGRSGSAITAEIATMVVQEEVGALQTMAINSTHFLVLPRFWAMSLTMPLLTICASVAGIFAGLLVGLFFFRLSAVSYLHQLKEAVTPYYLVQALVKSLTFSWIIALVSINKGLNARGGADAVGKATTSCVVTCIFSIIMADAVFSFLFYY